MSNEDIPLSFKKKMIEMQKRMFIKRLMEEAKAKSKERSPREIVLNALEDERAKEILELAEEQFPEATEYAISVIARVILSGKLKSIDAYLLYELLHALGVPVRIPTRIKFVKKGKEVDLKEYLE